MTFDARPPLRPPGNTSTQTTDSKSPAARIIIWAFVSLLAVLLAVVFALPNLVYQGGTTPAGTNAGTTAAPAGDGAERQAARAGAEQALQRALRLQAELRLANAAAWGEPEWSQVPVILASGDRLFAERQFDDSQRHYRQAVDILTALQASRGGRLQQALDAGRVALEADRADRAIAYFQQALSIEENHSVALRGLARAEVREQLKAEMSAAARAEAQGEFEQAIGFLRTAIQLDSEYQPAQQALARLEQAKADADFKQAMNEALAALQQGRFTSADNALDRAAQIDPQDPSLHDVRRQLALARQKAALDRIRNETRKLVQNENWEAAVRAYRRALAIDAHTGFARQGLANAEKRVALHQQFDHYLNDPDRLYSDEPLANAERLLEAVRVVPSSEPKLLDKRTRLEAQVSKARQPLTVRLNSDGQTDVVIYHVGRLGVFTEHTLQLKPGTYTAVGSRPGYRDARRIFTVKPGQDLQVVDIRCEEPV